MPAVDAAPAAARGAGSDGGIGEPVRGGPGTTAAASGSVAAALGPLASLLVDPLVTDVLVNGDSGVWVDRGRGVEPAPVVLSDERSVRRLAVRLAGIAGRRLDDASPYVDGLLPGGVRLHAVLPPVVSGGPHVSLRVPRSVAPSLQRLVGWGALDDLARTVLEAVVAARASFLVTGGTGSGKTTLLAAMLGCVDPAERLVVVEDVREVSVDHPHVVHLQGRTNNVEGRGEVTLTSLVRQSLRMRPDRVVVGEVRGAECRELMAALNTGHRGGCGTVHANAASDVVTRMEALGALASMSPAAVHAQLASAVEVVVHVAREGGRRRLTEVAILDRGVDGRVRAVSALAGGPGRWETGPGWGALSRLVGLPRDLPDVPPRTPDSPHAVR